jgi:hypothetical protein
MRYGCVSLDLCFCFVCFAFDRKKEVGKKKRGREKQELVVVAYDLHVLCGDQW